MPITIPKKEPNQSQNWQNNYNTTQETTNRNNTTTSAINKNEQIETEEFDITPDSESLTSTPLNSKSPINTAPPENLSGSVEDLPENIDYYDKIKDDGFTPQGYSYVSNDEYQKIFITAYSKEGENSRIYVYDTEGNYEGYIVLNSKNHVGGITYDRDNHIVFITASNGEVETYDYDKLIDIFTLSTAKEGNDSLRLDFENITNEEKRKEVKDNHDISYIQNDISILDEANKDRMFLSQEGMDTIYYHDGKLYSATYEADGKLIETSFSISTDSNGNTIITEETSEVVANIGPAVQGIAFYEENGEEYLITASSELADPSLLTKYKRNENGEYEIVGYKDIQRPGLEGIYIDSQGNITGVFEANKIEESDTNYQLVNIDDINKDELDTIDNNAGKVGATIEDLVAGLALSAQLWDVKQDIPPDSLAGMIIHEIERHL